MDACAGGRFRHNVWPWAKLGEQYCASRAKSTECRRNWCLGLNLRQSESEIVGGLTRAGSVLACAPYSSSFTRDDLARRGMPFHYAFFREMLPCVIHRHSDPPEWPSFEHARPAAHACQGVRARTPSGPRRKTGWLQFEACSYRRHCA